MRLIICLLLMPAVLTAHDLPEGVVDLTDTSGLPEIRVPVHAARVDTLSLEARWLFDCGEDAEILVGHVTRVASGGDGRVLLLDRQLSHVLVLDKDGTYLRSCGREGEGPSETNSAFDLVELSDGRIALLEGAPPQTFDLGGRGRLLLWEADGVTPAGTWHPASPKESGEFPSGRGVRVGGGGLVVGTQMVHVSPPEFITVNRLTALDETGRPTALLGERIVITGFGDDEMREIDQYEPYSTDRFDISSEGTVVCLPERDAYLAVMRRTDGSGFRLVGEAEGPRRGAEAKAALAEKHAFTPCDAAPVLASAHLRPDGRIWIERTPESPYPPGIFGRFDEFSPDGVLRRVVVLRAPGDPAADRLCRLADGRFALIRGHHADPEGEGDTPPPAVLLLAPAG